MDQRTQQQLLLASASSFSLAPHQLSFRLVKTHLRSKHWNTRARPLVTISISLSPRKSSKLLRSQQRKRKLKFLICQKPLLHRMYQWFRLSPATSRMVQLQVLTYLRQQLNSGYCGPCGNGKKVIKSCFLFFYTVVLYGDNVYMER